MGGRRYDCFRFLEGYQAKLFHGFVLAFVLFRDTRIVDIVYKYGVAHALDRTRDKVAVDNSTGFVLRYNRYRVDDGYVYGYTWGNL